MELESKSVATEGYSPCVSWVWLTVGMKFSAEKAESAVKTFSRAGISGVVFSGTAAFCVEIFS